LRPLVDVDDEFSRSVLQLLRNFDGNHLQGFSRLGANLLLLGDVKEDLHPFEVFGNRNAAMMAGSPVCFDGFRFNRRYGRRHLSNLILAQGFEYDGIEHHLVGIELLGLATVQASEQLLHLVLKGDQLALGGFEFLREFLDVNILLRDELVGLRECQYHGNACST